MYETGNKTNNSPDSLTNNGAGKAFFFQPKLTINAPGDQYEQEADRMAEHVMRMPMGDQSFFKPSPVVVSGLQRKCRDFGEDEEMHRKENSSQPTGTSSEVSSYIGSLTSKGAPLPDSTRSFFEPRFGQDFSDARIHNDVEATRSSRSVNALAYTVDNNIVFNENQFSPGSDDGKKLLAHELTHVVQQKNAQVSPKAIQRQDGQPDDNKLQITKSLVLSPPSDKLSSVVASPENKANEDEKAHLGFDFSTSVSPNPLLDPTPQTYAFSLVYRDFNIHPGSDDSPISADFGHEPNFQLLLSPDPHNAQIYQAAFTLVNLHFRRHRREFIEAGLSPQVSYAQPSGTLSGGAQLQVEWHIRSNFSLTASTALAASRHSDSAPLDLSSVPLGTSHGMDWSWSPISVGAVWHFR